ncbi:Alkylated DNA repair protein alkB-like [Gigaspora margarita]|uniref:Alkylated DNA repair protein alkB-like n=1 Tax=Gigaspora margarita TaxID=4874 RepID=A0A8H4ALM4_GIGMA|nr:Alkylated DNA repair protein alkB-like [Gigaspora margarita]
MIKSRRQQKLEQKQLQSRLNKSSSFATKTPFRDAERNFKSRLPPPDFSSVIDFYNLENCIDEIKNKVIEVELAVDLGEECENLFGKCKDGEYIERKKAYLFKDLPGFIFIRNPFTPDAQKNVIKRCLKDFTKHPNISNLDTHYILPKQGLWELYEKVFNNILDENDKECFIPLKATSTNKNSDMRYTDDDDESPKSTKLTTINKDKPDPSPSPTVSILPPSQLIRKLRWITLGYQYHWSTKSYHFDRRFQFPQDINDLTTAVVKAIDGLGYPDDSFVHKYDVKKWKPEAGVVNYYQLKDNLMAHVDRSEINMDAPLISFSFGHSCIFLIGGTTRETAPLALYLRSGDISIMCGPSRGCFHGVPRILEETLPTYLAPNNVEDPEWDIYGDFMSTTRINVNVRQVF